MNTILNWWRNRGRLIRSAFVREVDELLRLVFCQGAAELLVAAPVICKINSNVQIESKIPNGYFQFKLNIENVASLIELTGPLRKILCTMFVDSLRCYKLLSNVGKFQIHICNSEFLIQLILKKSSVQIIDSYTMLKCKLDMHLGNCDKI